MVKVGQVYRVKNNAMWSPPWIGKVFRVNDIKDGGSVTMKHQEGFIGYAPIDCIKTDCILINTIKRNIPWL